MTDIERCMLGAIAAMEVLRELVPLPGLPSLIEESKAALKNQDDRHQVFARAYAVYVDAARYRWLREQVWNKSRVFVTAGGKAGIRLGIDCPSGDRLDKMIDELREKP